MYPDGLSRRGEKSQENIFSLIYCEISMWMYPDGLSRRGEKSPENIFSLIYCEISRWMYPDGLSRQDEEAPDDRSRRRTPRLAEVSYGILYSTFSMIGL
jgi:hypothetical protein